MKAMILAAGLGTRMRPLTLLCAKPALPVLNQPLIARTVEALARSGVEDVVVNLHHLPGTVRAALGDGSRWGARVRYSLERTQPLGTGGGPRKARRWLGDGPVLIVNGDVLFDLDLDALLRRHRRAGALATLGLRSNPDPRVYHPVLTDAAGRVVGLPGCRRRRRGRPHLFTGISIVEAVFLERLPPGPSDSVRDLFAPAVDRDELIQGVTLRGMWHDLGTPELYRRAQIERLAHAARTAPRRSGWRDSLVDPRAEVARGATIVRSVIGAGVRVDRGARVERSVVWGQVQVGAASRVRRCIVAGCVLVEPGQALEGELFVGGVGRTGTRIVGSVR